MHKTLTKYYIAMAIFLIPSILTIYACTTKTQYEIITPGGTSTVSSRFLVEDGYDAGDLHSLYVYALQNSTPFQNFISGFLHLADCEKINDSFSHMTTEMWYQAGVIQKEQSEEACIINAYEYFSLNNSISINYEYIGAIVRLTTADTTVIKLGDIITHLNDVKLTSKEDLLIYDENNNASLNIKIGDKLTIIRDSEVINVVRTEGDIISLATYDKFNIYDDEGNVNATPKITINPTTSVGPSAGMMQTISIYNQLIDGDITVKDGVERKIIGTGTIETNGTIGAIGGVYQKVYSSYQSGADIMLVSIDNYEEALLAYNKLGIKESEMKLISVSNFSEVIQCLM